MYSTVFILRWCALAGMAVGTAQAAPVRESSDISSRGELNILVGGDVALRIMPLGASITFGTQSTDGNGYRQDLRNLLVADGNPVDMVGSQANGTMEDNQNEGWPGFRISQVLDKAKSSVPSRLPNLVLINAGTNNCIQNVDVDKAKNQTLEMLQYLWAASPKASIALSTLLVNGNANVEKCVLGVNEQLRALVQEQQAISKKVVLADMHTGAGPQKGDLVDGIHPNDAGYAKMAAIWFESIKDAASRGWLEAPQVLPGGGEAPPSTGSGTIP